MSRTNLFRRKTGMGGKDQEQRFVLEKVVEDGALGSCVIGMLAQLVERKPGQRQKPPEPLRIFGQEG
jgi:hypothetical protein